MIRKRYGTIMSVELNNNKILFFWDTEKFYTIPAEEIVDDFSAGYEYKSVELKIESFLKRGMW